MGNLSKIIVHRNGQPAEVQVPVQAGTAACQYVDEDGNVVATVIHDIASIAEIAANRGLEVEEVDHGQPEEKPPTQIAAETNAADRGEGPEPGEALTRGDDSAVFDPADHTIDEVLAYLSDQPHDTARIAEWEKGGKNRSTLIAALEETE